MICRTDNVGLGTLSWEFARHLKPHKILLTHNDKNDSFPERYKDFNTKEYKNVLDFQWLLEDIDIFFTIETPYLWHIIKDCRQKGIKSVLYTMYEMTPDPIPLHFDLYICPSKLDLKYFPDNKVFLPPPIATERLIWRKRTKARTFIHTGSHGGMNMRKGTPLILEAMKYVKSEIEMIIYTWGSTVSQDRRVRIKRINFQNYWQLWREGDVLVYPQDYNGICLPIIEAMASGLGVITTDIFPFNEYMPKKLLFRPGELYKTRAAPRLMETDAAKINPIDIAKKIDKIANKDISEYSLYGRKWAQENSWKVLLPKYEKVFKNLIL